MDSFWDLSRNFIPRLFILGSYFRVCFFGKRMIKALECSQFLVGKFPSWGWSGAINYQASRRIYYSHSGHCPRHTRKTQKFGAYSLQWGASAYLNHEGSAHSTHMQTHTPHTQIHTHTLFSSYFRSSFYLKSNVSVSVFLAIILISYVYW